MNLTKPNVTPKRLGRKWIFLEAFSLKSIIFGDGSSNKKWRPCLKAFLSTLFRRIFRYF